MHSAFFCFLVSLARNQFILPIFLEKQFSRLLKAILKFSALLISPLFLQGHSVVFLFYYLDTYISLHSCNSSVRSLFKTETLFYGLIWFAVFVYCLFSCEYSIISLMISSELRVYVEYTSLQLQLYLLKCPDPWRF